MSILSKFKHPSIIRLCEDLSEDKAKIQANLIASAFKDNPPAIYGDVDIANIEPEKLKDEHVIVMLPDHDIVSHLSDYLGPICGLASNETKISLCGLDSDGTPWFIGYVDVDSLIWLDTLMKELEHAKQMDKQYKNAFIGSNKKFPGGTIQWAFSQQVQQHHSPYLNSLETLVRVAIEDDFKTSVVTFPVEAAHEDRNRACQEAHSE